MAMPEETVYEDLVEAAPDANDTVRKEAAKALAARGVKKQWQLLSAPRELLLDILPVTTMGEELMVALHTQQKLAAAVSNKPGDAVALQMEKLVKEQRASRKHKHKSRSDSSSTVTDDDEEFDASEGLSKYGLPKIPHEHLPAFDAMKPAANKARHAKKKNRASLVQGEVCKWAPQWMQEKPKCGRGWATRFKAKSNNIKTKFL